MAAIIPPQMADLLTGKALANLATVGPTGFPLVTPVWVDREGELILVNSAQGRRKDRNVQQNAKVALAVVDPANPYRYLGVQGTVVEVRSAGADEHLDRLAQRYLGQPKYPWRRPGEQREILVIRPTRVRAMGG
ncbi:MAG TPA: PPOX class F420-dependent oxidoreductase [bacterium]|nr:PPOX class F420-dependent oxidoreductase [bacterium]